MKGQERVNITEERPSKFVEGTDGYEVTSNDETIRIQLRHATVMDGGMESDFYHTEMWVKEDNGWIRANNVQNYKTKKEFIDAIRDVEEFTQAIAEMRDRQNV
jgi:hypothetical protein